jgi:glucokinase
VTAHSGDQAVTYAGFDLGGTNIAAALGTADGRMLAERCAPTRSQEGPAAVLARIAELVRDLGGAPAAVGGGIPGLLDLERGQTLFLPNFPTQWRGVPAADILRQALGCPVYILNDARLATLGEARFGHGRTARTMVLFTLGTGIGGGVVLDGRLRALGGEIGHQTVAPDGPQCGCGNRGCVEALASGPALVGEAARLIRSGQAPHLAELTGGSLEALTPREMAQSRDPAVRAAIVRAGRYLGIAAANLVTSLQPELLVFAGGVAAIDLLLDTVREVLRSRVRMFPVDDVRVERSLLGDRAGVYGGIALAAQGGYQCDAAAAT